MIGLVEHFYIGGLNCQVDSDCTLQDQYNCWKFIRANTGLHSVSEE